MLGTRFRRRCTLLAVSAVAMPVAAADEPAADEIVVTATRAETGRRELAAAVDIVDGESVKAAGPLLTLAESLGGVPGLYLQNRNNFAQDLRISMRGFGARAPFNIRGVKLVVDGIPQTLPDGQASVDSIDLGSAGRIEVLRGPASSLYGNAAGGVISITTEAPPDRPFASAAIAGGSDGYRRIGLQAGGDFGSTDLLVSVSRSRLDGYRDHARLDSRIANLRAGWEVGERDRVLLVANYADQPLTEDAGGITFDDWQAMPRAARTANIDFDAGESLSQSKLGIVWDATRGAGRLRLRNYYAWRDFDNRLPFESGGSVDLERRFAGIGAQFDVDPARFGGVSLGVGVDLERQDDDRRRFDNLDGTRGALVFDQNERVESRGVFMQARSPAFGSWQLSAGLRYDEVEFIVSDRALIDGDDSGAIRFSELSPGIGISRPVGRGTFYATVGTSFETPTTTELANPDNAGGFNPALDAQTATNVEAGWRYAGIDHEWSAAVYRIRLDDELVPFELPGSPGRTFFTNAGSSTRNGLELQWSWRVADAWRIDSALTLADFRFDRFTDADGNDFAGRRLPGDPQTHGRIALRRETGERGFIEIESLYSGARFADNANAERVASHVVTNLRALWPVIAGRWTFDFYAGINNLFDADYVDNLRINAFGGRYYEPAPDRGVYAGVGVRFDQGDSD